MELNKRGKLAENFFSNLLYRLGLNYKFVDSWYDYEVEGLKIEIKSCQISISNRDRKNKNQSDTDYWQIGRFDFHNGEFWGRIKDEDIWIALIVRHKKDCLLYGFIKSDMLRDMKVNSEPLRKTRYLSLHVARSMKPLSINEWMKKNKIKPSKRICPYCGRRIDDEVLSEV